MTADEVMNGSAALLNDTALSIFTYAKQIPYLNIAIAELRELLELNNIAITNNKSDVIIVAAGVVVIDFSTTPDLPSDLIEIQQIGERNSGTTNDFIPMTRVRFLPMTSIIVDELIYWAWQQEQLRFLGATSDRDIELNYIASTLPDIEDEDSDIVMINSKTFLMYRNAALCAEFIGENESRANSLNGDAILALDRTLGINIKGEQAIVTRRRPFQAGSRVRGY